QEQRANLEIRAATLAKYRAAVEGIEGQNAEIAALEARLREAEGGLLNSKTPPLASAEMQELVKQLTAAHSIEVRSSEFLPTKPLGAGYLQVPLGLQFQCRLDQLVNFLKAAEQSPKYLAVSRLFIQSTANQEKFISVSMTVAGVMTAAAAPTAVAAQEAKP
ncbi:MAG: hypothetical protein HY647_07885, partial [Acidobacteria bacterium]|nr:hypothetical protein [Acidobacteriota bacterium]